MRSLFYHVESCRINTIHMFTSSRLWISDWLLKLLLSWSLLWATSIKAISISLLIHVSANLSMVLNSLVFGEGIINDATSVVLLGAVASVFPPTSSINYNSMPPPFESYAPPPGSNDSIISNSTSPLPASPPPIPFPMPMATGAENHSSHTLGIVGSFIYLYSTSAALGVATGFGIALLLKALPSGAGPSRVSWLDETINSIVHVWIVSKVPHKWSHCVDCSTHSWH